jgi:hypothetical protein
MKKQTNTKPNYYVRTFITLMAIADFHINLHSPWDIYPIEFQLVGALFVLAGFTATYAGALKEGTEKETLLNSASRLVFSALFLSFSASSSWGITKLIHNWSYFPLYERPMDITLASLNSGAILYLAGWEFALAIFPMIHNFGKRSEKLQASF